MNKKVLLMNDLPGYGRAALSVMMPVISQRGHTVYNLPTAVISNTLDFGKYNILDTTDYMKKSLDVWKALGFSFDAVALGYIVSEKQGRFVREFCESQAGGGTVIWTDPVMADNGKLYNGMSDINVQMLRGMLPVSDYIVPNYTEAVLLAGETYHRDGITVKEAQGLTDKLIGLGAKSVVITSTVVDGENAVAGYDHVTGEYFILPYTPVQGSLPGTGDIFLSLVLREALDGAELKAAVGSAMETVKEWIISSKANEDCYHGIQVEKYF